MSHRHHLICLVAAIGLAVWFLVAGSGGFAVAGVGLALLICPLAMGGVMWLLIRQTQSTPHQRAVDTHEEHASADRR